MNINPIITTINPIATDVANASSVDASSVVLCIVAFIPFAIVLSAMVYAMFSDE